MKRAFGSGIPVLLTWLFASTAHSEHLLAPIDSVPDIPADEQEYLDSDEVIRYRFVRIDVDDLWQEFESARDNDNLSSADPLLLNLFDGLLVEMRYGKVHHRYWWSQASLRASVSGADPEVAGAAHVQLQRGAGAEISIRLAGDIYQVSPVGNSPIHVVLQLDPAKMPNLD